MSDSDDRALQRALDFLELRPPASTPLPCTGSTVGGFLLKREIGRGAHGVVFEAVQSEPARHVALKLTPIALDSSRTGRDEAEVLARVEHPALLPVYAAGFESGYRYLAMGLVDGHSLHEILTRPRDGFPHPGDRGWIEFVLRTLHAVAGALSAAHDAGLVHRDVKPSNILIDRRTRAFLVDFGLARPDKAHDLTWTEGFVGTPSFASPEQIRGEPLTAASDIYSFGATAFLALTGRPPFAGDRGRHALERQILFSDARWTDRIRLSTDIRAVVERCLEKDPSARYPSAADVEADFERLLRNEPVSTYRASPLRKLVRSIQRRPWRAVFAAAAALLALLAGSAMERAYRTSGQLISMRIQEARQLFHAGDTDAAASVLAGVAHHGEVAGLLGDLAMGRGENRAAAASYRDALEASATVADRANLALVTGAPVADRTLETWEQGARTARDHDALGQLLAARREFDRAAPHFATALQRLPGSFPIRHHRARMLMNAGRMSGAIADYRVLSMMQPGEPGLLLTLIQLLEVRGPESQWAETVDAAFALFPNHEEVQSEELVRRLRTGAVDDALRQAAQWIADRPGSSVLRGTHAWLLAASGRHAEAKELADRVLAEAPSTRQARSARARVAQFESDHTTLSALATPLLSQGETRSLVLGLHFRFQAEQIRGDRDAALATLDELRRRDPEQPLWAFHRSDILLARGDLRASELAIDRAMALGLNNDRMLFARARIAAARGDLWSAILCLEKAMGRSIENDRSTQAAEASAWLSRHWLDLEEPSVALRYAQLATDGLPNWSTSWLHRAWCEAELRMHAEAASSYLHALRLRDLPQVRADYAEQLHLAGREREAVAQYRRAQADDPKLPSAFCGEAVLRLDTNDPQLRDPEEAVRLMRQAVRLAPDSVEFRSHLTRAITAASNKTP